MNNSLTWKKILVGVGSRGMGAIKAFLIGSVCNKICYDSPICVLIIK
ncbi:MAG: universal stress protein [Candidatus Bathyarchaeota archaeon]|nr:universal stress protein [Candidatus Bathyarchaeota archaeon]